MTFNKNIDLALQYEMDFQEKKAQTAKLTAQYACDDYDGYVDEYVEKHPRYDYDEGRATVRERLRSATQKAITILAVKMQKLQTAIDTIYEVRKRDAAAQLLSEARITEVRKQEAAAQLLSEARIAEVRKQEAARIAEVRKQEAARIAGDRYVDYHAQMTSRQKIYEEQMALGMGLGLGYFPSLAEKPTAAARAPASMAEGGLSPAVARLFEMQAISEHQNMNMRAAVEDAAVEDTRSDEEIARELAGSDPQNYERPQAGHEEPTWQQEHEEHDPRYPLAEYFPQAEVVPQSAARPLTNRGPCPGPCGNNILYNADFYKFHGYEDPKRCSACKANFPSHSTRELQAVGNTERTNQLLAQRSPQRPIKGNGMATGPLMFTHLPEQSA